MKTSRLTFFASIFSAIFFFVGCIGHPMDGSMRRWDHMMGYGNYGGMFMWILLIIIVAALAYFVINRGKTTGTSIRSAGESPTEILKKRYARGEITKEEYERFKKDIEN